MDDSKCNRDATIIISSMREMPDMAPADVIAALACALGSVLGSRMIGDQEVFDAAIELVRVYYLHGIIMNNKENNKDG
jgi:hypothetical protein